MAGPAGRPAYAPEALRRVRRSFSEGGSPPGKNCPVQASGVKEESLACTWTSARVYLLDFARAPPDTITDSAALLLPEAV